MAGASNTAGSAARVYVNGEEEGKYGTILTHDLSANQLEAEVRVEASKSASPSNSGEVTMTGN